MRGYCIHVPKIGGYEINSRYISDSGIPFSNFKVFLITIPQLIALFS